MPIAGTGFIGMEPDEADFTKPCAAIAFIAGFGLSWSDGTGTFDRGEITAVTEGEGWKRAHQYQLKTEQEKRQ